MANSRKAGDPSYPHLVLCDICGVVISIPQEELVGQVTAESALCDGCLIRLGGPLAIMHMVSKIASAVVAGEQRK